MPLDQLPGPHLLQEKQLLLEPVLLGRPMVVLGNGRVELRVFWQILAEPVEPDG